MSRFTVVESSIKIFELFRFEHDSIRALSDPVSVEEPLEVQIVTGADRSVSPVSVTMRTPGNDEELAVGFLVTEGIIGKIEDVLDVKSVSGNVVQVSLAPDLIVNLQSLSRNSYTTSSCGVCGKASIDAIRVESKKVRGNLRIGLGIINELPERLLKSQPNFQSTGGLHASALFDKNGVLKLLREDVGRHNALDKVIGCRFLQNDFPIDESILLVSGRASFELIQKAVVAGIQIVAAIGAPSSLAVELAQEKGVSLVGFLKKDRFNVYSHKYRIQS